MGLMPVPCKHATNASLICSLCERQWRREYGGASKAIDMNFVHVDSFVPLIQAQACLNGPVAALVKSGPRKGSTGTDVPVHFSFLPGSKEQGFQKRGFDEGFLRSKPAGQGPGRPQGSLLLYYRSACQAQPCGRPGVARGNRLLR